MQEAKNKGSFVYYVRTNFRISDPHPPTLYAQIMTSLWQQYVGIRMALNPPTSLQRPRNKWMPPNIEFWPGNDNYLLGVWDCANVRFLACFKQNIHVRFLSIVQLFQHAERHHWSPLTPSLLCYDHDILFWSNLTIQTTPHAKISLLCPRFGLKDRISSRSISNNRR